MITYLRLYHSLCNPCSKYKQLKGDTVKQKVVVIALICVSLKTPKCTALQWDVTCVFCAFAKVNVGLRRDSFLKKEAGISETS